MHSQWFLVGAGRCGLQLARAMAAAGIPLAGIEARSPRARARARRALPGVPVITPRQPAPRARAVLLAVPDSAIGPCAETLARRLAEPPAVALHTSGAVPARALGPLRARGCRVASLHPLVSFPTAAGAPVRLVGVAAAVEGDRLAAREAARLARALGMFPFALNVGEKPLYHAAAALAANMTHVLVAHARVLLRQAGLPARRASAALRPLVLGSVEAALAARGLENLTGPLARADAAAVAADARALRGSSRAAYRSLARLAVGELAREGIVNSAQARSLLAALTD